MKKIILLLTLLPTVVIGQANFKFVNSNISYADSIKNSVIQIDTVPCYFREVIGISKDRGSLLGVWSKGYVIEPKGRIYFTSDERPVYLREDKKTRVKNVIIQTFQ